jgi:8-oxo-dGTP pyrophosphatase MutT (NUDIX family)
VTDANRTLAIRTVRAVLRQREQFLLVVHHGFWGRERWGLPGGRIESGEDYRETARRELREELSIEIDALAAIGDYRYNGALHRVFGAEFDGAIVDFDRSEIQRIGWHTLDDVVKLAERGALHTGFEETAIRAYLKLRR